MKSKPAIARPTSRERFQELSATMQVIGEQALHAAQLLQALERDDLTAGQRVKHVTAAKQLKNTFKAAPATRDFVSLIERRMRNQPLPPAPLLEHVRRNADARDRFIAEHGGLLTSQQVAQIAGSAATNKSQIAHRWRKEGSIFAVEQGGLTCYPALQFDALNGRPLAVIKDLIVTLNRYYEGWALALWFVTAQAWLNGKRPLDLLLRKPENVLEAAQQEMLALDD